MTDKHLLQRRGGATHRARRSRLMTPCIQQCQDIVFSRLHMLSDILSTVSALARPPRRALNIVYVNLARVWQCTIYDLVDKISELRGKRNQRTFKTSKAAAAQALPHLEAAKIRKHSSVGRTRLLT